MASGTGSPLRLAAAVFLRWTIATGLVVGATLFAPPPAQAQGTDAAARQFAAAAALQNREQWELAADEWEKFVAAHGADPRLDKARHYLGVCRLKAKDYPRAVAAFSTVVTQHPKSDQLEAALTYLGLAQFNLAQAGDKEQFVAAERSLATAIERFPQGKLTAQARFYQAECQYARGDKVNAAAAYALVVQKYPKDPIAADALYALGVAQGELKQPAAAAGTFAQFLKQYGSSPLAGEVGLRLGESLLADGKAGPAAERFAAIAAGGDAKLAELALLRWGASLFEQKQYDEAAARFLELTTKYKAGKYAGDARLAAGKSLYFAGKLDAALEALDGFNPGDAPAALEAGHWRARALLKAKRPADALARAEAALALKADGPYRAQLELDRADALSDLPDRQQAAFDAFARFVAERAEHPLAPQAEYLAAFTALGLKQYDEASRRAGAFLQRRGKHELARDVRYVAAEARLLSQQYDAAVTLYAELRREFPKHADAGRWLLRQALALHLKKDQAGAIALLDPAANGLPAGPVRAEAQYVLGVSRLAAGDAKAAVAALEASVQAGDAWSQADEALLALAAARQQAGDGPGAVDALEQFQTRFPHSPLLETALLRLGDYASATKDTTRAATAYQALLERGGGGAIAAAAHSGLGWTALDDRAGDPAERGAEAERRFTAALAAREADDDVRRQALYGRGLARRQQKKFNEAMADLKQYLADAGAPQRAAARYALGLCQVGLNDLPAAEQTFARLVDDEPDYAQLDRVLYELGWARRDQNEPAKQAAAAAAFEDLARLRPDSPLAAEALYLAAEHYDQEGDFSRAATAYYAAAQKAGMSELGEKAAHKLGFAYFNQKDYEKARQSFAYQRARFPQGELSGDGAFMEAECLFQQGKHAEAVAAYEAVKNPRGPEFAALAALHAGQALAQLKKWNESLAALDRGLAEQAQSVHRPEMTYERAWALQNVGRVDEALEVYAAVPGMTDREAAARACFMIGELQFERRQHAEAIKSFFKAAYGYGYPRWQAASHYEAGRCFEVLGKPDQAKKSYQEVVEKHPMSEQAKLARERLQALGG